jgi:hypothetical protein
MASTIGRFEKLPRELRDRIYEYTLAAFGITIHHDLSALSRGANSTTLEEFMSFAEVSTQLYDEFMEQYRKWKHHSVDISVQLESLTGPAIPTDNLLLADECEILDVKLVYKLQRVHVPDLRALRTATFGSNLVQNATISPIPPRPRPQGFRRDGSDVLTIIKGFPNVKKVKVEVSGVAVGRKAPMEFVRPLLAGVFSAGGLKEFEIVTVRFEGSKMARSFRGWRKNGEWEVESALKTGKKWKQGSEMLSCPLRDVWEDVKSQAQQEESD